MNNTRSVAGAVVLSAFATLFLSGCAHDPDVRDGHDYTSGVTEKSPPAYLGCVKGELPSNAKVYEVNDAGSLKLFVDSTDPAKAGGLVEVRDTGTHHAFTAYQRDAWYDHGRLLDAALMCSRA